MFYIYIGEGQISTVQQFWPPHSCPERKKELVKVFQILILKKNEEELYTATTKEEKKSARGVCC